MLGPLNETFRMNDKVEIMPKHRILIVDDEAAIRDMLSIALEAAGFNVLQADNAQQAHASIIDNQPDLVLLDWMMPGTTGLELLRRLKRDELTAQIPIIMLTAKGAENDIVGAFSVTPGVITTGDQGGQLYVRGGTPIQNKILLDGMTIYNPFHSIGFFSIFETELIKNVDIYTGGFESKYGGRISSIMDITYRDLT